MLMMWNIVKIQDARDIGYKSETAAMDFPLLG